MDKKDSKVDNSYRMDETICRSILLAFDKKFKYDYSIPRGYYVTERLLKKLSAIEICQSLREKIEKVIDRVYGEGSTLEHFMNTADNILRSEWFYNWGNVYTWRYGQKAKSVKLMRDLFSEEEQEDMEKVWEILKPHTIKYNETHRFWND